MGAGDTIIHSNEPQNFDANIRVMAGPGAGKTFWLVGQIKQILAHSSLLGNCRKVAVITYTNKATDNIIEQIHFGMDRIEVSTIHAFLYANVIKPYFHLIAERFGFNIDKLDGHDDTVFANYKFYEDIIKEQNKAWLIKGHFISSKIQSYLAGCNWFYDGETIELKSRTNNFPPYKGINLKFATAYKDKVWREKGIMHHDDVLYFSYQLFKECPRIKKLITNKFPYILVDEYQDSSSIQHSLVQQLASAGCFITIIGDEAQSIYSFANGDIKYIKDIQLPNMVSYHIEDNHRSTKEIVDFLNIIRPNLKQETIRKEHFSTPMIVVGSVLDAYNKCICMCKDKDVKTESIVTLSRKNETANDIRSQLTPTFQKGHLMDDILALSDSDRSRKFVACLNAVENARQMLMKDALKDIAKGFGFDIKKMGGKKKAMSFLRILCSKYGIYSKSDGNALLQVIKTYLHQNISAAMRGKPKELFSNLYADFAREVKYLDDTSNDMTIHKAKGLGFKNVFVVFEDEQTAVDFLMCNDLEQDTEAAEEHRIYYVACSRACNRLFLSIPSLSDTNKKKIEDKFSNPLEIVKI